MLCHHILTVSRAPSRLDESTRKVVEYTNRIDQNLWCLLLDGSVIPNKPSLRLAEKDWKEAHLHC